MKPAIYISAALLVSAMLGGCSQHPHVASDPRIKTESKRDGKGLRNFLSHKAHSTPAGQKATERDDIWAVVNEELGFALQVPDEKIPRQLAWLEGNQNYFDNTLSRASLYLPYVLEKVIEANLPAEVALLPFIESAYNPFAYSPSGAAGLWQFIPDTGSHFGLDQNRWFEGRRDIVESTDAAIAYLQRLNKQFDGDWLLTFAAYNGGPGTVRQAIAENKKRGLDTDFWSLDLRGETRRYVPRLIALSKVLAAPDNYDVNLAAIPATPTIDIVELDSPIDLAQAAKIAGIDVQDMYHLNPGYTRWVTPPEGPYRLVLPSEASEGFLDQLSQVSRRQWLPKEEYVVKKGDTLSKIASTNQSSLDKLATLNGLTPHSVLQVGQILRLPTRERGATFNSSALSSYRVRTGDSLWSIARSNGLNVSDLVVWNDLNTNRPLQVGQLLNFYEHKSTGPVSRYQVQGGDSLYRIAKRFKVKVSQLAAWNQLSTDSILQPGQQLKILR